MNAWVCSSMRLGVPFIAPRQLGAIGGILGRPKLPSVGWRSRPLQLCGSWHTGQSGAPLLTVGAGHASPADLASDRCAGGRWLTGQSGAPPDSPVNYSRTPPNFSGEWPVRRRPAWRTGHCPVHHRTVWCARLC
jgi:hypothetical protein